MSFLHTPLQFLKGVGPKMGGLLKKNGLSTFWDALSYLPRRYELYASGPLASLLNQKAHLSLVCVKKLSSRPFRFLCRTFEGEELELVFFHDPKCPLYPGSRWYVQGLLQIQGRHFQISHPCLLKPWTPQPPLLIAPHYSLPQGVVSSRFSRWIQLIFDQWPQSLPLKSLSLQGTSLKQSLFRAHFPQESHDIAPDAPWRTHLASEELLAQHLAHLIATSQHQQLPSTALIPKGAHETHFLAKFGHSLTPSQAEAWQQISRHLAQSRAMMHLLHGDVGSGKTVVAFLAMVQAASSGYEACLMAPTEILARQHFQAFTQWSPDLPAKLVLGGGKTLGDPQAPLLFGTHALLYEGGAFSRLGLVVVDEQQRFGVMQRLALLAKGRSPHLLFLSATPIPRTFEMVLWGYLTTSRLASRPKSQPLKSYLISDRRLAELEPWIRSRLSCGECVYWVCPMIQGETASSVEQRAAYWAEKFPGQVATLHGRMTSQEKAEIMENFRQGRSPFLISTTVIEVGVHVSQASTMVIESSERFGLSQLHQLRGRVGRDHIPGHCFFIYTSSASKEAYQRLDFMRKCHDGFEIAEKDWQWRGSGVLLGTQQSGILAYKFADLSLHQDLVEPAFHAAKKIWAENHDKSSTSLLAYLALFGYRPPEILQAG